MNTQHFIYALEIEKTRSVTQAASNLFMTQPTLSKAVKDLEDSLGFAVFKRTSKGMIPTQKGAEFLVYAKRIAQQLRKMDSALHAQDASHQLFSLAIPRASYIAQAASEFICSFDNSRDMEIEVMEASSLKVMEAVADGHFVLGIIRCRAEDEDYFLRYLDVKDLQYETLWQSNYQVVMHQEHPLADQGNLREEDFAPYIEILFGDNSVPYAPSNPEPVENAKRILISDRAMKFDLLRNNKLAYIWSSPVPSEILQANHLVQRKCRQAGEFKDLLISRAGYHFSKLDRKFIDQLFLIKNKVAFDG